MFRNKKLQKAGYTVTAVGAGVGTRRLSVGWDQRYALPERNDESVSLLITFTNSSYTMNLNAFLVSKRNLSSCNSYSGLVSQTF